MTCALPELHSAPMSRIRISNVSGSRCTKIRCLHRGRKKRRQLQRICMPHTCRSYLVKGEARHQQIFVEHCLSTRRMCSVHVRIRKPNIFLHACVTTGSQRRGEIHCRITTISMADSATLACLPCQAQHSHPLMALKISYTCKLCLIHMYIYIYISYG
jgi:hypothetical protein